MLIINKPQETDKCWPSKFADQFQALYVDFNMKGQYQDNTTVAIKNLSLTCFILIGSFLGFTFFVKHLIMKYFCNTFIKVIKIYYLL